MILALDPDSESHFQILVIPDPDSDPVKNGIVTPLVSFSHKARNSPSREKEDASRNVRPPNDEWS